MYTKKFPKENFLYKMDAYNEHLFSYPDSEQTAREYVPVNLMSTPRGGANAFAQHNMAQPSQWNGEILYQRSLEYSAATYPQYPASQGHPAQPYAPSPLAEPFTNLSRLSADQIRQRRETAQKAMAEAQKKAQANRKAQASRGRK